MPLPSSQSSKFFRATQVAIAFIFVSSVCNLDAVDGFFAKAVIDSPLLRQKIATNRSITVDINGNGDFKSVQAAIDSVPDGNSDWIIIHVRKGVYREKVSIPHNKPYIFMRGNGKGKTAIDWSQSSEDNIESATFKVEAPHFVAFGISFKNEAPTGIAYTSQNQSVAAYVGADMVAFYHCAFYSSHNTLFDLKGRHYYDSCYIQGSIDFIFGHAQSIFHSCDIFVIADRRMEIHGSITAHKRESAKENTGFVFIEGQVFGIGDVYLGRAKGAYSRVIFANTYISKTVVPQGWTNWSYAGSTERVRAWPDGGSALLLGVMPDLSFIICRNLHHAEYNCHGPGSNSTNRAPWSKQLSDKEAAPFLSIDFINGKDWLPAWL
ncbi:unnamed protein product [Camellia sinensis]